MNVALTCCLNSDQLLKNHVSMIESRKHPRTINPNQIHPADNCARTQGLHPFGDGGVHS